MDEAKVIRLLGQMGQQVGDVLARLPSGPEFPGALVQGAVLSLEGDQRLDPGHRLAVPLDQLGLVVPGVQMADRPGAEEVQDALRPGRKRGGLRRQGPGLRSRWSGREQPSLGQQGTQGDSPHSRCHVGEEPAAIEQMLAEQSLGTRACHEQSFHER